MGCDDYPLFQDRYLLGDTVAQLWDEKMARRFPHASHRGCRQSMRLVDGQYDPKPFNPVRCLGWHCPQCGEACGMYGHRQCDQGRES